MDKIKVNLVDHEGNPGVTPTGDLTVRVAVCLVDPTENAVWKIDAFSGNAIAFTGSTTTSTKLLAGNLYNPPVTMTPSE